MMPKIREIRDGKVTTIEHPNAPLDDHHHKAGTLCRGCEDLWIGSGLGRDSKPIIELKLTPSQREDAYRAIRNSRILERDSDNRFGDGFRWASDRLLERLAEILREVEVRTV